MRVWRSRHLRYPVALVLAVLLFLPAAIASAATVDRSSTGNTVSFTTCGGGPCVTLYYAYDAFTHITYDWTDLYHYTLHFEDQSIIVHNANASGNPCGVTPSIYTDTYYDGNFAGTVYVQTPGSYAYPAQDINWGGYAYPEITINGMTARGTVASSNGCLGGTGTSFNAGP